MKRRVRQRRRFQVTCHCPRYSFPHRIGGGRCDSSDWAEAYYLYEGTDCLHCNNNHNGVCEVATGGEPLRECQAYQEALRQQHDPVPQLIPLKWEQY